MKYCPKCGVLNDDNARFCCECGNVFDFVQTDPVMTSGYSTGYTAEEQQVIDGIKRNFRREKTAYKLVGLIGVIIMSISCVLIILAGIAGMADAEQGTAVIAASLITYAVTLAFTTLPVFIINLVASGKLNNYISTADRDIEMSRARAGSIGMIVFAAIFNDIALIFVILNFIYVKRHRDIIESIKQKQRGY